MCKWLLNWIMDRGWKNFEVRVRKNLDFLEETVSRNVDVKCDSVNVSNRNE